MSGGMHVRFLGWAGLEVTAAGSTLLIDPLGDPAATPLFEAAVTGETVPPSGPADAALLTHLHRDHADADTLAAFLPDGAPVLCPEPSGGEGLEAIAVAQAEHALTSGAFDLRRVRAWDTAQLGPFTVTAVPAADGTGELQVSWVVEADGARILHAGDTIWHGWWWTIASRLGPVDCAFLPANGPVVDFPHRQPATDVPAAMTPEQAVEAAHALQARRLVPIHYGTYCQEGLYAAREDVPEAVAAAAARREIHVDVLDLGEVMEVSAPAAV